MKYIIERAQLRLVLVFSLWLFFSVENSLATTQTVHIALTHYPPILNTKGSIATDIVSAAFRSQGIHSEYHQYPMSRVFWAAEKDNIQLVLGSRHWLKTSETQKPYSFISFYRQSFYFFGLQKNFPEGIKFDRLEDLKDKSITYIKGGGLTPVFNQAGIEPHYVSRLEQIPHIINSGRRDLFAALEISGWDVINQTYPYQDGLFIQSEKPIYSMTADIMFPHESKQLIAVFRQGLLHITKSGDYIKILKKYYKSREIPAGIHALLNDIAREPDSLQKTISNLTQ